MIHIKDYKYLNEGKGVVEIDIPKELFVSLSQHIGKPAKPVVKVGDEVKMGQLIAQADGFISANIHSPVSGKVKKIGKIAHPALGAAQGIVIENNGLDEPAFSANRTVEEVDKLSLEQLVKIVQDCGIVGLGGAAFPTHVKLQPKDKLDTLLINAAECEPYITSDAELFSIKYKEIFSAILLVKKLLKVDRAIIGIEDNKPELIKLLKDNAPEAVEVFPLPAMYPQGGEKQLIKNVLGREVPLGGLPSAVGVVVQNTATMYAIYEAVYLNKPLYERLCTVSGLGANEPKNLWVRVGMPFEWVIEQAGGMKDNVVKVIAGGPMMGFAQPNLNAPIVKASGAILCLTDAEAYIGDKWEACIRCGRCVDYCPMGLLPADMGMAIEREKTEQSKEYGLMDCIECGVCTYVCPSKRPIVQWIKKAKYIVRKKK